MTEVRVNVRVGGSRGYSLGLLTVVTTRRRVLSPLRADSSVHISKMVNSVHPIPNKDTGGER